VDPEEERSVRLLDELGRGVFDVEHPRGVQERPVVGLPRSLELIRRTGEVASWSHASTVG